ncbi:MAG: mannose-1-phosphate guanyltransferase [Chloroflexi bacterium]|nr:mannose-1-phosphate guanyltransferase [Chloroflexota bacterium]
MLLYALIMAGGSGTRLWPLSRQTRPKQALKLFGERTMFQLAVDRLLPILPSERILVVTTADLADMLSAQSPNLPRQNFVIEPEGRGTAPVIGLGALCARRLAGGEAVIACLTADHFIRDVEQFRRALLAAAATAERGHIVTLGIKPSFPSTGFGYIERGEAMESADGLAVYRAARFKEKPNEETAVAFVADGCHSWNSGMFIWTTKRVSAEFERQLPDTSAKLREAARAFGTSSFTETLARVWPTVEKQTIDYAIMEGARDVAVIPVDIGWSDVGSWASLLEILEPDENGNVVIGGQHIGVDTTGALIRSDKLVATIGLSNVIIVDTDDAIMICQRDRSQDVRQVVERLQQQKEQRYL